MSKTTRTITTIKKDGTTITTTTKGRRKKAPPAIDGKPYDTYSQGVHLLCTNIQNICASTINVIDEFNKFYPMGEAVEKLQAVRKVFMNTSCFVSNVKNWVIEGKPQISAEDTIDF